MCRIPGVLTSREEFSAGFQPESARVVLVQTDRSTLTSNPPHPSATERSIKPRAGRAWVWFILAGAVAVGVINVVAIALRG